MKPRDVVPFDLSSLLPFSGFCYDCRHDLFTLRLQVFVDLFGFIRMIYEQLTQPVVPPFIKLQAGTKLILNRVLLRGLRSCWIILQHFQCVLNCVLGRSDNPLGKCDQIGRDLRPICNHFFLCSMHYPCCMIVSLLMLNRLSKEGGSIIRLVLLVLQVQLFLGVFYYCLQLLKLGLCRFYSPQCCCVLCLRRSNWMKVSD